MNKDYLFILNAYIYIYVDKTLNLNSYNLCKKIENNQIENTVVYCLSVYRKIITNTLDFDYHCYLLLIFTLLFYLKLHTPSKKLSRYQFIIFTTANYTTNYTELCH